MTLDILIYAFIMAYAAFIVNLSIVYLSFLDWYRREDEAEAMRALKVSAIISMLLTVVLLYAITNIMPDELAILYRDFVLVSFILSIMILYPFLVWIRKKIYAHFYVAAYLSYNILVWFLAPPFLYSVLRLDYFHMIIANYLLGAILGTLLATAIIREIRPREWILGGLPAVTTAISVADFVTRAIGSRLQVIVIAPGLTLNLIHVILIASLIIQYIYYKRITER